MESMLDILPNWIWVTWALVGTLFVFFSSNKWTVSVVKWLYSKLSPPKRIIVSGKELSRGDGLFDVAARSSAANGRQEIFFRATVVTLEKPVMIHDLSLITLDGHRFFASRQGANEWSSRPLDLRIQQSDKHVFAFSGTGLHIFSPVVAIRVEFVDGGVVTERPHGFRAYVIGLWRLRAKRQYTAPMGPQ